MTKTQESILVVDDDLDFLKIIRRILEGKGFEVATAASASEALEKVNARFYNAAVLDISLPDADGTELLSGIIERHPDITAVMLTGHSSVQNAVKSLNCGAFAYLEKPLDPDNLLSVINRGLEKQRLVLENRRLVDQLEQHNRVANTLLGVSQVVSQSLDLKQIIDSALEKVSQTTDIDAGFVYLHQDDRLVLAGHHGLPADTASLMEKEINAADTVIGKTFRGGRHVIINDGDTSVDDPAMAFLRDGGYRAFAGVPLKILGESIGVIGVASANGRCFSKHDTELLAGIGREIAIAVRNAQLYEEASSARALRELDSMRTEFLANVSHELRTPLAVIKGSANSLLQPDVIFDDETRQEFLQSIDRDADTLTRLVDDLLMMSRLEADALELKIKPHKLCKVVDFVRDRLEKITVRHRLSIDVPEELPPVLIDEGRIGEVLTNLVENAAKYSDEATGISVTAALNDKNEVTVSVADEGIGIAPELHQKIFDRFFQGNGQKNGRRRGTGLGLAICHGIVEAHHGSIWVESEPQQGSRFSFTLPTG